MTQISLGETQNSTKLNILAKNALTVLLLQIAGVISAFLVQVFLARWMGKNEYGIYEYIISWSIVLAIPVSLGLPRAVLRFISEYRVRQQWGELRGLILIGWQSIAGIGLLFCLGGTEIISYLDRHDYLTDTAVLLVGIWLIPLQALIQLQEDMARGVDNLSLAYGPSKVLWPLLVLGSGFFLLHQNRNITGLDTIRMALLMLLIIVVFQGGFLWFKFSRDIGTNIPIYKPYQWLLVALPLLLNRTFEMLLTQTDILMVGLLIGSDTVGIYSIAAQTALWTAFVLNIFNLVAAPVYAMLHTRNDREELQNVVATITLWLFAPTVAIALILIVFTQPILNLFGPEFSAANLPLKILAMGYFIDVMCGPVDNLMAMTGYHNQSLIVSSSCGILNIGLNLLLIPQFGSIGAAISTTFSMIVWNVCLGLLVRKNLDINPSVFYHLRFLVPQK